MSDERFWIEAKNAWTRSAPSSEKNNNSDTRGRTDSGSEVFGSVSFDDIDSDMTFESILNGGDLKYKEGNSSDIPLSNDVKEEKKVEVSKPKLDTEKYMSFIEKGDLPSFIEACNLLLDLELPAKIEDVYRDISDEMETLQDAIVKFEGIYHTDMSQFIEYYIPESLELVSTYLEYFEADVDPNILEETEEEVMSSSEELLVALRDKKNELYKFGSMELKARSKALESMMSQDGHVSPEYKINN